MNYDLIGEHQSPDLFRIDKYVIDDIYRDHDTEKLTRAKKTKCQSR